MSKAKQGTEALFKKNPRSFRIGGNVRPQGRDLSRFVRWPANIRLQRKKKILFQRLKVPPSINQFSNALDKNGATALFRLLNKYRPETKKAKAERLRKVAADAASGAGSGVSGRPPARLQFGLNHVVNLIEQKKAKLVCIASDVDPIELVVFIPALCKNMGVPYCIVKNRSRLGTLVNQKNATCVAVTEVNKEDAAELDTLVKLCTSKYNDAPAPKWGDRKLGLKTIASMEKRAEMLRKEQEKKNRYA
jgi:large subunit ribosomal protein L7Ae